MSSFSLLTTTLALACASTCALAQSAAAAAQAPLQIDIVGARQRLDSARSSLSPDTGSSVYRFDHEDIAALPLGDATPLNQLVLRTPGVVQDAFGGVHVRGDHGNLQYRVDGVVIPESIGGFGASLDTRFAENVSVFTGALPAQYGYRTAGVVDIRTKGAAPANEGRVELTVDDRGQRQASLEAGGSTGRLSFFGVGSFLQSELGMENPTPSTQALHDATHQAKGFGDVSWLFDDTHRLSLMAGSSNDRFQIPDVPGQSPQYTLAGTAPPDSAKLDARQRERNDFAVLSFQGGDGRRLDYQLALFQRRSGLHYLPDPVGDLVYSGVASDVNRTNTATGLQADGSYKLDARHTLRAGLFLQHEKAGVDNRASVFPADAQGAQASDQPLVIEDNGSLGGQLAGVYLQDEWQPSKALTVNYGLRYDRVTTLGAEQQWSSRLGAVWQPDPKTRVHAGYARYFTPPPAEKIDTTSVALFAGTTNALPSDAETSVKSERSHYLDVGIEHQLSPRLTISADLYRREVRHLQDEGQFGRALVYSAFNFQQGLVQGVELAATYRESSFSAYANVALSSALGRGIESGQFNFDAQELDYIGSHWVHLDHDQRLTASAGASWKLSDGLQLNVDGLFGSGMRRGFANTDHLPGYAQLDASASRSFELGPFGRLEGRLGVQNLLDRVYQLRDGSGIGVGAPQFGPRRTWTASLAKPFTF